MFHHRSTTWVVAAIVGLTLALAIGCKKTPPATSETRSVFGTDVTLAIYDPGLTAERLRGTFDEAFQLMSEWEKKTLLPGADNQVAAIAEAAGERSIPADKPVFDMLIEAIRFYDTSGKVFDIRYGPMRDAWGFGDRPRVPSAETLDSLKQFVEQGGLFVAGNSILLAKKGMRFDVREIAIGAAFDQVAAKLAGSGIRSAMISCPRVCRTMGDPPDKRGFEMTVGDPHDLSSPWAKLSVPVGGIAYACAGVDRFSENGMWYHSLLDPRTGWPAARCAGTIVQAPSAAAAQALAYGAFVFGTLDSLDRQGRTAIGGSVVIREDDGTLTMTSAGSLADKIERIQ